MSSDPAALTRAGTARRHVRAGRAAGIAVWGVRIAVALALAELIAQFTDYGLGLRSFFLDSSTNRSLAGALSMLLLCAAAAGAWLLAWTSRQHRTTAVLTAVLLNTIVVLKLTRPPHVLAIAALVSAAAVVLMWRLAATNETGGRLVRAGCIVLAVSFVAHALGAWLVSELGGTGDSWLYQAKVVVKHAGELSGWTLLAFGFAAMWSAERSARSRTPTA